MPKLKKQDPKNCRDRNQAFSWHNGKRIYHGVWGSPEAKKNYRRFCTALDENPVLPLRGNEGGCVIVAELADGFLNAVESGAIRMDKIHAQHFARAIGYLEVLRFLISQGADVHVVTKNGKTTQWDVNSSAGHKHVATTL